MNDKCQNDHDDNDRSFSSNSCPFNAEISSKLTAAFAKATGIDVTLAVEMLNQHGWNIDQALRATYDIKEQTINDGNWKNEKCFRILSWNVNMADSEDEQINEFIQERTEKIIDILQREKPEIIFLQQIGTFALTLMITCLSSLYDDESIQIDSSKNSNYISILTNKSSIKKSKVAVLEHENHWRMLQIEIFYRNSIHLDLFNAFIDENSTSPDEISSFCFQQIDQRPHDQLIVASISNEASQSLWNFCPSNLKDFWESTDDHGQQEQRPDRLLFRLSSSNANELKPIHCEFENIELVTRSAIHGYFNVSNREIL